MTASIVRPLACLAILAVCACATASERPPVRIHYLGNAGVMVEHGSDKVIFDPLFRNDFGIYELVPAQMEKDLFAGVPPWDDIDAVFVSHHHGDHFDPEVMLNFLLARPAIDLFAPRQAADALLALEGAEAARDRIHGIELDNGEATDLRRGALTIAAMRVPHSGWPENHATVENIVFRLTLRHETTIMHFGDAQDDAMHFANDSDHWHSKHTDVSLPPYWFSSSQDGHHILHERFGSEVVIGVHVPAAVPDNVEDRPAGLREIDLFTRPGEVRELR